MKHASAIPRVKQFAAAAVLLVVSGCQAPDRQGERIAQVAEPEPRQVLDAPAPDGAGEPPGATAEPSLGAIQEFLERTREYAEATPKEHAPAAWPVRPEEAVAASQGETTDERPASRSIAGFHLPSSPSSAGPRVPAEESSAIANVQMEVTNPVGPDRPASPRLLSLKARPIAEESEIPPVRSESIQINQPATLQTTSAPVSLTACMAALERQAEQAAETGNEWALWLTRLAHDRLVNATEAGESFAPQKREVFRSFLAAATDLREWLRNPRASSAALLDSTEALRAHLADAASPSVENIALCRRVVTFGVYEELPDTALLEGREIQVIVYCEVANLASELEESGEYRTRASTRLELLREDGVSMWSHEEPEIEDLCRRKRRDFFIAQRVTFPPTLTAGRYVLKIAVEDLTRQEATEALHPLQILPSASVAERNGRR